MGLETVNFVHYPTAEEREKKEAMADIDLSSIRSSAGSNQFSPNFYLRSKNAMDNLPACLEAERAVLDGNPDGQRRLHSGLRARAIRFLDRLPPEDIRSHG